MEFHKSLVRPENTLAEVVKVIDRAGSQIALVVDGKNKLLGTVTDGDVRRAFLNGSGLENSVSEVMCVTPKVCLVGEPRSAVKAIMDLYQLDQIPIVDREGVVVQLETLREVTSRIHRRDNPVFLMAGGFGTRLRPLTEDCPKPMLKVGNKPILERILESLRDHGFWNFYISLHYMPEVIENYFGDGSGWGVEIKYVYENEPLGTGGALGLLPSSISKLPLIVINGDVLTTVNFLHLVKYHTEVAADITVCARKHNYQIPYGVIETNGNYIEKITEKPTHEYYVNAGIYLLSYETTQQVRKGVHLDMPSLISAQLERDKKVASFPIYEYWLDIGQMPDYEKAQIDIQRGLK